MQECLEAQQQRSRKDGRASPACLLLVSTLELVRLFSIYMDRRGLIRIGEDFDLLGIETLSIPLNPYGLENNRTSPYLAIHG